MIMLVMGSSSDWEVMKKAEEVLLDFDIPFEKKVVSAHRMASELESFTNYCEDQNVTSIIAGAGGAAHLPGMLAAFTYLPVIGVPVKTSALDGVDSLYSIVQMPKGVPVATVGINNATNAALLAIRMLAVHDDVIKKKLIEYKEEEQKRAQAMSAHLV